MAGAWTPFGRGWIKKTMTESRDVEESIQHSIRKNGFPEKIVRLPFKPVYESCKRHGTSLNVVLQNLEEEQVYGKITGDYIEFRSPEKFEPRGGEGASENPGEGPADLSGDLPPDLQAAARQYMADLDPEQVEELRKMVENLSEEEKKTLLQQFAQRFKPGSSGP